MFKLSNSIQNIVNRIQAIIILLELDYTTPLNTDGRI